jgi:HAE1 family hydrophobic/amphiphilic exporter-1
MVGLYDSFIHRLWYYFAISFIGAMLALALTNNSLNIFTILGIIMLIGLVCKKCHYGRLYQSTTLLEKRLELP